MPVSSDFVTQMSYQKLNWKHWYGRVIFSFCCLSVSLSLCRPVTLSPCLPVSLSSLPMWGDLEGSIETVLLQCYSVSTQESGLSQCSLMLKKPIFIGRVNIRVLSLFLWKSKWQWILVFNRQRSSSFSFLKMCWDGVEDTFSSDADFAVESAVCSCLPYLANSVEVEGRYICICGVQNECGPCGLCPNIYLFTFCP